MDSMNEHGFSTIELLVAIALGSLVLSAVFFTFGSVGAVSSDSALYRGAIEIASEALSRESRRSYDTVATSTEEVCRSQLCYTLRIDVPQSHKTHCSQLISAVVTWSNAVRPFSVGATTSAANVRQMRSLGGACDSSPPLSEWLSAKREGEIPAALRAADVFGGVAYLAISEAPYISLASVDGLKLGETDVVLETPSLALDVPLFDIHVFQMGNDRYLLGAADSSAQQLVIARVTNPQSATVIASSTLPGATGSYPQGFRTFYFEGKAYIVTRETAGPELFIFDIADPSNPVLLSSYALDRTIEQFLVTRRGEAVFLMGASDRNSSELSVFDVTSPSAVVERTAPQYDLAGNQDGSSIYLLNDVLYLGRLSGSARELHIFDARDPAMPMPLMRDVEIAAGVLGIHVSGNRAFLLTTKANEQFQIYASYPATVERVAPPSSFTLPLAQGLLYSRGDVFTAAGDRFTFWTSI